MKKVGMDYVFINAFITCSHCLSFAPPVAEGIDIELTTTNTPCIAIGSSITLTCTSSESPETCASSSFEWFMNGEPLYIFRCSRCRLSSRGENVADLTFVLIDSDTHANFSCGLLDCGRSNNFTINPQSKSPSIINAHLMALWAKTVFLYPPTAVNLQVAWDGLSCACM